MAEERIIANIDNEINYIFPNDGLYDSKAVK